VVTNLPGACKLLLFLLWPPLTSSLPLAFHSSAPCLLLSTLPLASDPYSPVLGWPSPSSWFHL
jgi:hypothetical protein